VVAFEPLAAVRTHLLMVRNGRAALGGPEHVQMILLRQFPSEFAVKIRPKVRIEGCGKLRKHV